MQTSGFLWDQNRWIYFVYDDFQIKNANREGEYFEGIAVDVPIRDQELGTDPDEVLRNVMAFNKP